MGGTEYVQSLARGLEVIRAFTLSDDDEFFEPQADLSLTEVAERTGLSRATARRFLLTLAELGYVRAAGRSFRLTPKVLELGYSYFASSDLPQLIQPVVEQASDRLGESVSASVLEDSDIVYIARAHTRRIMRVNIAVGTRFPAYPTSMGRVHLAYLPEEQLTALLAEQPMRALTPHTVTDGAELRKRLEAIRHSGWSRVEHELEIGLRSVAVPIFSPDGSVAAAINVALGMTNGSGASEQELEKNFVEPLREAAAEVEASLRRQR